MDPYVVCSLIVDTTLLDTSKFKDLADHYKAWKEFIAVTPIEM